MTYCVIQSGKSKVQQALEPESDSFSTIVDPTFLFDPSFDNAGLYSLQFSPGIVGNGIAGVPGPIAGAGLPGRSWPSLFSAAGGDGDRKSPDVDATKPRFFCPVVFSLKLEIFDFKSFPYVGRYNFFGSDFQTKPRTVSRGFSLVPLSMKFQRMSGIGDEWMNGTRVWHQGTH